MDKYGNYIYNKPEVQKSYPDYNIVEIGSFVSFAAGVVFKFLGLHEMGSPTTYSFSDFQGFPFAPDMNTEEKKIIVGNDVWFGQCSIVLQNSIIGDGAVIGAHSVVRGYIEPYSVVIGNPAITIRKRFSEEQIKELLEIQWWNWDIEKIKRNIHLLKSELDIKALRNAK